ncbi:polycomb complex protein BMI-1-B-like isoform X1 [Stylophora pistillata]|uniref:polycomb complex protein BMI-1-B-like isoform X1 n=1 Tax=Stylophora pistillata TaxID=50429 RepID=UPI000C050423|nr:polycomb complex protein BMI-1-B-like isoform X1 [Stylophora pistillata]
MLRCMKIQDLNPHIMCMLCGGYLVDATTIVECLHSFCRSCIVKYLQASYHCPVCAVEVHKTKPLLYIRPDRTLQEIVFKLVPGLYQAEQKLRHDFEENQIDEREESKPSGKPFYHDENVVPGDFKDEKEVVMEDPVCVTLEYYRRKRNWLENQIFPTRYLRCPSAVTVDVLKKFLVAKFAIPNTHQAEIIRSDEILDGQLTMREVSRIYGLYAKSFLDLEYAILEVGAKEEPTQPRKEDLDITRWKKIKIKKRKKRNKKLKEMIATELLTRNETVTESKSELPSLPEEENKPLIKNDILPTFPDTPPNVDHVQCSPQIDSPA